MNLRKKGVVVTGCFLFLMGLMAFSVSAAIEVDPACEGTLIITNPNATDPEDLITMVECGMDPIPEIPQGAILEVFDGKVSVKTGPGDSIDLTVLDHEVTAENGTALFIQSGEDEGLIEVVKGSAVVVDPIGNEIPIQEGQDNRYPIRLDVLGEEEVGTEALEPTGRQPFNTEPPVDSRSRESSP